MSATTPTRSEGSDNDRSTNVEPFVFRSLDDATVAMDGTVNVKIEYANVQLDRSDLCRLREGSLFELQDSSEVVLLVADGKPIAKGQVVTMNGQLSFQIDELIA